MSEQIHCRMRITFRVEDTVKYISHLDLLRAWERILRRAGVPLAYSQGFNPHPRIVIAMPLPVGCTGEKEIVDAILDEPRSSKDLVLALEPALPVGITVVGAKEVALRAPALPSMISYAVYRISLENVEQKEVIRRVNSFMAQTSCEVQFRRKTFDLRPLVGALAVRREQGTPVIEATLLRSESGRIGRPDVLLEALSLRDRTRHIQRVEIAFEPQASG